MIRCWWCLDKLTMKEIMNNKKGLCDECEDVVADFYKFDKRGKNISKPF